MVASLLIGTMVGPPHGLLGLLNLVAAVGLEPTT